MKAAGTEHVYPPHYLIPELMTEFMQWLGSAKETLHPLEYASEAHYQFVSIHPFRDGNSRTGRLLMNLLLLQAGFPIVTISNQKRQTYIEALAQAQQSKQSPVALLELICQATHESLIETLSVVATATDSKGKGEPFYAELITFLENHESHR